MPIPYTLLEFAKAQLLPAKALVKIGLGFRPMLVFDGEKHGIAAVPDYAENKEAARAAMREMLKEFSATRYAFTMEARFAERQVGQEVPKSIADAPDRKEAICISAADKDGGQVTVMCEIIRTDDQITFAEPKVLEGAGGDLLELLDAPRSLH